MTPSVAATTWALGRRSDRIDRIDWVDGKDAGIDVMPMPLSRHLSGLGTVVRAAVALLTTGLYVTLLAPSVALAQTQSPSACSNISDRDGRLACYDGIFPPTRPSIPPPTVGSAMASASASGATMTTGGVVFAIRESNFGLSTQLPQATELKDIQSRISGRFDGWTSSTRWRLDNGQLWTVADGSSAGYDLIAPKVRVIRGLFGAFYIEIEGVNQTPRVRRVE